MHELRIGAIAAVCWSGAMRSALAAGMPADVPPQAPAHVPAQLPAQAPVQLPVAESTPSTGYEHCEEAVAKAIRDMRGASVQALRFDAARHAQEDPGSHLAIQGTGHYLRDGRTPVAIRYSCAYDAATGTTSGVLFHESDGTPAPALPVWRADLAPLAIDACESAVAERLQSARPRASGIAFEGADRSLAPGTEGGTLLDGGGRYAAAAGLAPGAFRYRCEFDAAGRLRDAHAQ